MTPTAPQTAVDLYRQWDVAVLMGPQSMLIKAQADAALAEQQATIESMKRCGNCVAWTSSMHECDLVSVHDMNRPWSGDCFPFDRCHFPESRWELCDE